MAQSSPQARLHGLDGDLAVLDISAAKARRSGVDITWTQGFSFALPYADGTFDHWSSWPRAALLRAPKQTI